MIIPILLALPAIAWAAAPDPAAMSDARQWTSSKLHHIADSRTPPAHLLVTPEPTALLRDGIKGRPLMIAGHRYRRGLAMRSPGEIVVRIPAGARRFEAVLGVDSNDVGYYSNAGRGNVSAAITAGGQELYRSPLMHESMAGIPVSIDLKGAREFRLALKAIGERGPIYQSEWDQADWADARVVLADGTPVNLSDLPVGPLPAPFSTDPPFSFRYGGRASDGFLKTWRFENESRRLDDRRTEHTARYTDPATGMSVRCVAVAYDDFPTLEWTVYFRNGGTAVSPILEQIQALDIRVQRGAAGEFVLHHARGSFNSPADFEPLEAVLGPGSDDRIATRGGRPTDTDLGFFNIEWPAQGLIVALGWPGQWSAQFTRDKGETLHVTAGQQTTHFRLLPGEEVRGPLIVAEFWRGDRVEAQNTWRRWMMAHSMPHPGGKLPAPQMAGSSGRFTIEMQEANEENQKSILARILDAGVRLDCWWMDAGWYPLNKGWWHTGTWDPDPARFPKGFTPVSAVAHARGLKIIVWFEPERVTAGSWLAVHHPEWLIGVEGQDKLLYLGNPEARKWLTEHVSRIIAEQGIDIYRQDFNFEPLARWASNDTEDRQGITEIRHIEGYLAYFDELRRRFPNLLIDTCASGGRRLDVETLRRSVPLWRSDFPYEPAPMQLQTYGLALWVPYFGTAINSVEPYLFRSQMTPAAGLGFDPATIEDGYRRFEHLSSQWREVAGMYYGDFYPLTPYSTDGSAWIGWQFNRPEQRDGMVQAFRRPESPFESARFRLRGLDAGATYSVTDIDSRKSTRAGGKELMERGLAVSVTDRPGAIILTYRRD